MKTKINSPILLYKKIIYYSLLGVLVGIFLWPQLASLSSVSEEKITDLTNKERESAGLGALAVNPVLAAAARAKAISIFASQTFQHNIGERKFSDWIRETGYEYSYVGENLAMDFVTSEGAIRAWMRSDTHKKNILNAEFSEIGVAVLDGALDGDNTTLIVQIFGSPRLADNAIGRGSLSGANLSVADDTAPSLTAEPKISVLNIFDYAVSPPESTLLAGRGGITPRNIFQIANNDERSAEINMLMLSDKPFAKKPGYQFLGNFSACAAILAFWLFYAGVATRQEWKWMLITRSKQLKLPLR